MSDKRSSSRRHSNWKEWWQKGHIQRTARITYDIVWNIVLFFFIIGALTVIFAGGVGAGYFASLVKDEPIRDYDEMRKDIYNYEETSKLYFADEKYIGDIRADLHREQIDLEDISENVIQAVIATEDEMFYEHKGIVPKAIVRALYQEVTNSDSKTGGSTLTQQLIKNQILTNEVSFERKAKEILLALRLENFFEKDEILEAYLNIVPYGRDASGQNIAGIQTAAQGIFGIDASELNLPQAAYLAGMPKNPFAYTPFDTSGKVKDEEGLQPGLDRMKVVLRRMHRAGYINEEEYEEALEYDVTKDFTDKGVSPIEKYPALVFELERRAKEIIRTMLIEEDGYSVEEVNENEELSEKYDILAERSLRMDGYHIHSTIDKDMYDAMQKVTKEYEHYGPDRTFIPKDGDEEVTEQVETGAVLIENETGRILSFVPGREDSLKNQNNHATGTGGSGRPAGSTFKPLAVYAPAMELGEIQPGSVIADIPGHSGYSPKNYGGAYYGLVSAREALTHSYNVSTVEIYKKIVGSNPTEQFLKKMGIYLPEELQYDPSIALGTNNVTVEQNTNAFATFSNGGKFVESYMIEKITDSDGNAIYEHEPEPVEVFSPQTAYLTIDMMRDVVRSGTAASLPSRLKHGGVDWAGKTGTSDDYEDAWFIGTNPNVTMGVWLGYDTPSSIYCANCSLSYSQRTQYLWAQLINAVADIDPELIVSQERHKQPDGIVSRTYCAASGMAISDACAEAGLAETDIYNAKFVPKDKDDSIIGGDMGLVEIDGQKVVAGPDTPNEFIIDEKGGFIFNPDFLKRMGYDRLSDLSVLIPRRNAEAWKKISFDGETVAGEELDLKNDGKAPPAPSSIKTSGTNITWSGTKGHLIVGYRIYYAPEDSDSFKAIGHTIKPSYSLPNQGGKYYVVAVNYFGVESEPSKTITLDGDDEKDSKQKDKDKKEKDKGQQKEKRKNDKKKDKKKDDGKDDKPKDDDKPKEDDEPQDGDNDDGDDEEESDH